MSLEIPAGSEAAQRDANPAIALTMWTLKAILLWIAQLAACVVAYKLVPVDLPVPAQDGPLTSMQALLTVSGLIAISLSLLAAKARVRGWRLAVLLFAAQFLIGSAMMQIETVYFNESIRIPLAAIGGIVAQCAIVAAFTAMAGAVLFRPAPGGESMVPANLLPRVAAMAVIYVLLYYGAGFFIAWQSAAVRAFYGNGIHIDLAATVAFQIFRGTLWALIALYIATRMKGSLASRALVMAVLFAVLTAGQLLYPNTQFGWDVRRAHLMEVGSSEFVYGLIATFVLLAGAARKRLDPDSPWRLIAKA